MQIKIKLPAVAIDEEGNEQSIEVEMTMKDSSLSIKNGEVKGRCYLQTYNSSPIPFSFTFVEEHPFKAVSRLCDHGMRRTICPTCNPPIWNR
jgi:hypothetical protein